MGSEKRRRKRTSESESDLAMKKKKLFIYHLKVDFHSYEFLVPSSSLVCNEGIIICTHFVLDSQVHLGHQQHSGRKEKGEGGMSGMSGNGEREQGSEETALYPGSFLCMVREEESAWVQG